MLRLPTALLSFFQQLSDGVWVRPADLLVRLELVMTVLLAVVAFGLWRSRGLSFLPETNPLEDIPPGQTSVGHVADTWTALLELQRPLRPGTDTPSLRQFGSSTGFSTGSFGRQTFGLYASRAPALVPGDFPVEALLDAMAKQSCASRVVGSFMALICKCDEANIRAIRISWEAHGRPTLLRELVAREKEMGVQLAPGRLAESASLALLWSMRMCGFWLGILRVLADSGPGGQVDMPSHATNVVYAHWIEPYHGLFMRTTFRTALRALPHRDEMLRRFATGGHALDLLVADCRRCVDVTAEVISTIHATLDELALHDEQKV